jgi:hypothetical protein
MEKPVHVDPVSLFGSGITAVVPRVSRPFSKGIAGIVPEGTPDRMVGTEYTGELTFSLA